MLTYLFIYLLLRDGAQAAIRLVRVEGLWTTGSQEQSWRSALWRFCRYCTLSSAGFLCVPAPTQLAFSRKSVWHRSSLEHAQQHVLAHTFAFLTSVNKWR